MTTAADFRRPIEQLRQGPAGRAGTSLLGTNITGPVVITNPDAVKEGFSRAQFPLTWHQEHWARWYDADYTELFVGSDTMANGRAQLQKLNALPNIPVFRTASLLLTDAALSEMPAPSGATTEQQEWWEAQLPDIQRALQPAARQWGIYNLSVIAVETPQGAPPRLRSVDPRYYYRVGRLDERDAEVGHILMFPFREGDIQIDQSNQDGGVYNRITVVKVLPDKPPTTQTFEYAGSKIGRPITAEMPSTIQAVFTAGEGDSWYGGARDAAANLMIAAGMAIVELNQYANRVTYLHAQAATAIAQAVAGSKENYNTERGRKAIIREFTETLRPYLILNPDEDPPGDSAMPPDMEGRFRLIETFADLFYMISRMTPNIFGIGIGRGESGVAREQGAQAASIAVRRYRGQLADVLGPACILMGMPGVKCGFVWPGPPFQSREAREEQVRLDWEAGLITRNEARADLGRDPAPGQDVFVNEAQPQPVDNSINGDDNGNAPAASNGGAGAQA